MCIPLFVILLVAVFGAHLCFTMPNVAERLTPCAAYDTRLLRYIHVHLLSLHCIGFHWFLLSLAGGGTVRTFTCVYD
jgi:hypothetical protein